MLLLLLELGEQLPPSWLRAWKWATQFYQTKNYLLSA